MDTLRDIMTTEVLSLSPDATLREAAELLDAQHIGGVPVLAGGRVVGVVSVSDIIAHEADDPDAFDGGDAERRPVGLEELEEEMASGPDSVTDYFAELWQDGVRPDGWRTTLLAIHDEELRGTRVAEIMSRDVIALGPDATVEEAARLMLERDIHRVVVLEDGELAGLVTTTDLVRAVAQHGLDG